MKENKVKKTQKHNPQRQRHLLKVGGAENQMPHVAAESSASQMREQFMKKIKTHRKGRWLARRVAKEQNRLNKSKFRSPELDRFIEGGK